MGVRLSLRDSVWNFYPDEGYVEAVLGIKDFTTETQRAQRRAF